MIWWWICGFECEGFGYLSNNLMTAVKLSVSSRSLCVSKSATRSPCWWCASWWWWPWWAPSSWSTPSSSSSSRWPLRQVPHRRRKSHRAKHIRRHSQSCTPPGWTSWWWWSSLVNIDGGDRDYDDGHHEQSNDYDQKFWFGMDRESWWIWSTRWSWMIDLCAASRLTLWKYDKKDEK